MFTRFILFPFCRLFLLKSLSGRGNFYRVRDRDTNFEPMLYERETNAVCSAVFHSKDLPEYTAHLSEKAKCHPPVEIQVQ